MTKLQQLKDDIALFKEVLEGTTDADERAIIEKNLKKLESTLSKEEESASKEKTSVPEEKKTKVEKTKKNKKEKKGKVEKAEKPKKEKKKVPDCDDLAEAWKKRMKAVKAASGKRTAPIGKILADKMEGVIKSVIAYDKRTPSSNLDLGELKKAVDMLAKGLDKLTEALNADLGDNFIKKFKEDLAKIIKALEEKKQ